MENKKIKAIIFDVGGVLTKVNGFTLDYVAKKLNIELKLLIEKRNPEYSLLRKGKINKKIAFTKISKKLKIHGNKLEKSLDEAFRKTHKKNNSIINLSRKLKRNYKIAILSNQIIIQDRVMKKMGIYKFFDRIVLSYKTGSAKPELKIYKITLKKLKLKPEECIFIDNLIFNLKPAKKLGINTILFKNTKQLKKDLIKLGIKI